MRKFVFFFAFLASCQDEDVRLLPEPPDAGTATAVPVAEVWMPPDVLSPDDPSLQCRFQMQHISQGQDTGWYQVRLPCCNRSPECEPAWGAYCVPNPWFANHWVRPAGLCQYCDPEFNFGCGLRETCRETVQELIPPWTIHPPGTVVDDGIPQRTVTWCEARE